MLCSGTMRHPGWEQTAMGTGNGTCGPRALLPTAAEHCTGTCSPQQLAPGGVFQQHRRVPHHHQERLGPGDCHVEAPRGAPEAQVGICGSVGSVGRVRWVYGRAGRDEVSLGRGGGRLRRGGWLAG